MAKKGGNSQPQAPDPAATAAAQTASNKETAITQARLNQVNEVTPFGSATYSPTGSKADGVDLYQRTVSLSPDQQRQFDLQNALQEKMLGAAGPAVDRINNIVSTPFNLEGLPNAPVADDATRQRVEDALFQRARGQLDPVYEQQQRALETSLANQGFSTGSEGYRQSLEDFRRSQASAYDAAQQGAVVGGGAEQSRLFGLEGSARERAIQERTLERSQPINELATIMGQSGGVNVPQFGGIPQSGVAPTDVVGPINTQYQSQLNAYNQQQQQQQATMGSLFGLGGQALGAWLGSDPEMKTGRKPVSMAGVLSEVRDMPIESWRYKGSDQQRIGPMADKFAAAFGGDGHGIDGGNAFGVSLAAIKALAAKVDRLERRTA